MRGLDIIEVLDNDELSLNLFFGGRDDIINFWDFNMKKKCKLLKIFLVN